MCELGLEDETPSAGKTRNPGTAEPLEKRHLETALTSVRDSIEILSEEICYAPEQVEHLHELFQTAEALETAINQTEEIDA